MRKKFIIIFIIIVLMLLIIPKESENIRVRVVANSDSYVDQNHKNNVVLIMKRIIKCDDSYDDVVSKMDTLKEEVGKYAKANRLDIDVLFSKTKFPTKSLNDKVIQGGVYDTVLIKIGDAEGKNYWSLLYPEYYGFTFEDVDSKNIEVKFYFWEKLKMLFS